MMSELDEILNDDLLKCEIVEYEWEEVDRDNLPYAVSVKVEER